MMQENGLINHWLDQQKFNMTIKNNLTAHNYLSDMLNCMTNVLKMEKEFQLTKTNFLKVTLSGLRILFYIILGGFALSIVILLSEILWLNCVTNSTMTKAK